MNRPRGCRSAYSETAGEPRRDAAGYPTFIWIFERDESTAYAEAVRGCAACCAAGIGSVPGKLHADKAYNSAELRRWVLDRGIGVRIARKGIESSNAWAATGG